MRLRPEHAAYRINLGTLLLQLNDAPAAVRELNRALNLIPTNRSHSTIWPGFISEHAREIPRALELARRLATLQPTAANYDLLAWACYAQRPNRPSPLRFGQVRQTGAGQFPCPGPPSAAPGTAVRSVLQAVEIFAPCRSFLARADAFLLRRGHAATFWLRLRRATLFLPCVLVAVAVPSVAGPIRFRDATKSSGIGFVHTDGSSGKRYIVETVASGLGLIDFDGDGDLDIYFLNGAPLPGTPAPPRPPSNELYRNNGDGTFTDVTAPAGPETAATPWVVPWPITTTTGTTTFSSPTTVATDCSITTATAASPTRRKGLV